MQTFLPYPDFWQSLRALDKVRLGCQRKEAAQILSVLDRTAKRETRIAWANHPAVLMWRNYEDALKVYYNATLAEFAHRGGHNIKLQPIPIANPDAVIYPHWLGYESLHASHRYMLVQKHLASPVEIDYPAIFAGTYHPEISDYIWPVRQMRAQDVLKNSKYNGEAWWQTHRVYDGQDRIYSTHQHRYGVWITGDVICSNDAKLIVENWDE